GIRDKLVTGVQTCALPIYGSRILTVSRTLDVAGQKWEFHPARLRDARTGQEVLVLRGDKEKGGVNSAAFSPDGKHILLGGGDDRSEERRVGKADRWRGCSS